MQNLFNKHLLNAALLIALTPIYYMVPWHRLPGPTDAWGIPFLFCYLLFLPGSILQRSCLQNRIDTLTEAVLGVLYGLFYFLLVSFIWALTGAHLASLQVFFPVTFLPLLFLAFTSYKRERTSKNKKASQGRFGGGALLVLLVCIPIFFFVWKSGTPIDFTKDTHDHIGYVNEIRTTGETFPTSSVYAEAGDYGRDVRKGLLHVFYGFSCSYLQIEALSCLNAWNAFFAVILILSVFGASLALFEDQRIAVLSSLFFIVGSIGGVSENMFRSSVYSNHFGFAFFIFLIIFILRILEKPNKRDMVSCAFFAFAACAVHILYGVLTGLAVATITVWKVCFPKRTLKKHLAGVFSSGAASMAGIAPYLLYRYFTAYGEPNELHKEIQGVVYITDGLFTTGLSKLVSWYGPLGLVAVLVALALWKERGKRAGLGYLIAACFTIPAVLLNPILLPPIQKVLTYLVNRFPLIFPFYMLLAYYVVHFLSVGKTKRLRIKAGWILLTGVALAAAIELISLVQGYAAFPSKLQRERKNSYLLWNDGLEYLRDNVPERSIVVSDPITSYSIAAFTQHFVVSTLDQHAPPGDRLLAKRIRASRDILNPYVSLKETLSLLEASRAEYIVLNNRPVRPLTSSYWSIHPEYFPGILEKFTSHNDLFEKLFDREDLVILHWNGETISGVEDIENPYLLQVIPEGFTRVGNNAGEARLEAFRMEKGSVERGGTTKISLVWSSERTHPFRNYEVIIRFDHQDPKLPLGGKPFNKIARKVKEVFIGARYRFRLHHKIVNGFLSPDVWPERALVLDETSISIPDDIVPGPYSVSVKLLALVFHPNYRLRDYLYDDDIYQGVRIGTTTIR